MNCRGGECGPRTICVCSSGVYLCSSPDETENENTLNEESSTSGALTDKGIVRCATPTPIKEEIQTTSELVKNWTNSHDMSQPVQTVQVDTYFHIIENDQGVGGVTMTQLESSLAVMNAAFAPYFYFNIVGASRILNTAWHNAQADSMDEQSMKSMLHRGNCSTLNIYSIGSREYLGWATFPTTCYSNQLQDGVIILNESVAGGNAAPYNLGYTLVHEVGHWLGLYHTFEGGCDGVGDSVFDTPAEEKPAYGCPAGRDTCRGFGVDPISNFMDYSDDACMNNFSPIQYNRMRALWAAYRSFGKTEECAASESKLIVNVVLDSYPQENSWMLRDECTGNILHSEGAFEPGTPLSELTLCIPSAARYTWELVDSHDDGICCKYGDGHYSLTYDGNVESEGEFTGSAMYVPFGGSCADSPQLREAVCKNSEIPIDIAITFDSYAAETSWKLVNTCTDDVVEYGGDYVDSDPVEVSVCVPPAKYSFIIEDSHGDGMCCKYGDGSYKVSYDGYEVAVGGEFNSTENVSFGGCVNADFEEESR